MGYHPYRRKTICVCMGDSPFASVQVIIQSLKLVDYFPVQTRKPYNNLLIAQTSICTLCIVSHLKLNIGISMKVAISTVQ